jgi:gliding motility-associated-like protein
MKRSLLIIFIAFIIVFSSCRKTTDPQCPEWTMYIPNSFEPNGDGLNDSFIPKGTGIASFEMWIFDNSGKQIYYCNNINNPWNGSVQGGTGAICPEGYYLYQIKATDSCGYSHTYTGTLMLEK